MDFIERVGTAIRNPRQVFFGWWTVLATGVMCSWGIGFFSYCFSQYIIPLQKEFGWSRAEISGAQSFHRLEGGLEGPIGGLFADRFGPRIVNIIGFLIAGIGLCSLYFVNSILSFYFFMGFLVALGFNLGGYDPLDKAIADWFVKKRGLALSIYRTIVALGATVVTPFFALLLLLYGWRLASLISGIITLLIGLPLTWFFVKPHRPEYYGLMPDGAPVEVEARDTKSMIEAGQELVARVSGEVEFTLRQAMRTRAFWIQVIASGFIAFLRPSIYTHGIPRMVDMGIDSVTASSIIGLLVLMSAPGRLIGGAIVDRVSVYRLKYVRVFSDALMVLALYVFLIATDLPQLYLFTVIYGIGMGINNVARPQIRGRFFGRKAFGTIGGVMAALILPLSALAPVYIGWIYDISGSYDNVIWQAIALSCVAVFVNFFLDPPKRGKAVSDIKSIV